MGAAGFADTSNAKANPIVFPALQAASFQPAAGWCQRYVAGSLLGAAGSAGSAAAACCRGAAAAPADASGRGNPYNNNVSEYAEFW